MRFLSLLLVGLLLSGSTIYSKEYSLNDLLNIAFENNHEIAKAKDDIIKSKAVIREAHSAIIPDVTFSTAATRLNNFNGVGVDHGYSWTIQATQPLYTGGRTWAAYDNAKAGNKTALLNEEKQKQDIAYSIIQAYYNILKAKKLIKVSEESLNLIREHKKIAEANFNAGTAVKTDVLRVEVREANIMSNLVNARASLKKATENLYFILGKRLDINLKLKEVKDNIKEFNKIKNIEKNALTERLDVKILKKQLDIYSRNIKIAKGSLKPQVGAFALTTKQGNEFPGLNRNWQVGVKLDWSAFDGGYLKGKVDESRSEYSKLKRTYEQLVDSIKLKLEIAKLDIRSSRVNIDVAKKSIIQAKENLRLTESRFRSGIVSSVVVLDDEVALTQSKTNYFEALYNYKLAIAKFYYETSNIFNLN